MRQHLVSYNTLKIMKEVLLGKKYRVMNILICYNLGMVTKKQTKPIGSKVKDTRSKVEEMLREGLPQNDIASKLGLTEASVSYHVTRIKTDKITSVKGHIESPEAISKKILSETEIDAIKRGHVKIANQYLNDKIPMLKNVKKKKQEFNALRPIHSLLKQSASDNLINKCKEALDAKLNDHIAGHNELTARDLASITGSINNIAAFEERQRLSVTPQSIQDMPEHMMYANSDQIINVKSNGEPLI